MATEPITPATQATSATNEGNKQVVFDEAQQARIQELIDGRMAKVQGKHRTELEQREAEIAQLRQQIDDAKKTTKTAPSANKDAADDEVARLRGELEEARRVVGSREAQEKSYKDQLTAKEKAIEEARLEAQSIRKESAMMAAISKIGFIDPSDIADITARHIEWSDEYKQFVVKGQSGQPELNNAMAPKSLEEFYTDYAQRKKHLVKSDVLFGTGAAENARAGISSNGQFKLEDLFGSKSSAAAANEMALKNPAEYSRLRKLAVQSKLIA